MRKAKVFIVSILILIPISLYCAIEFSKEERKARHVRNSATQVKLGMSGCQITDRLTQPDTILPYTRQRAKPLYPTATDTTEWVYHWGFGSSSDMYIRMKNDTAVEISPGE